MPRDGDMVTWTGAGGCPGRITPQRRPKLAVAGWQPNAPYGPRRLRLMRRQPSGVTPAPAVAILRPGPRAAASLTSLATPSRLAPLSTPRPPQITRSTRPPPRHTPTHRPRPRTSCDTADRPLCCDRWKTPCSRFFYSTVVQILLPRSRSCYRGPDRWKNFYHRSPDLVTAATRTAPVDPGYICSVHFVLPAGATEETRRRCRTGPGVAG
jgi:hypothetical protein